MKEKFLPIGTVVKLGEDKQPIMITTYLIYSKTEKDGKMYDYGACPFPQGVINPTSSIAFNHNEIKEVLHLGYQDETQKKLNEELLKIADKIKEEYAKTKKEA